MSAPQRIPSPSCPTFFRACIQEARSGGFGGFEHPGYHLGLHVDQQLDDDEPREELESLCNRFLEDQLGEEDLRRDVLGWLARELPRCIELVPRRRRWRFVDGFLRSYLESTFGFEYRRGA